MIRLFVALPLPEELRLRIALLAGGIPGANWVAGENLHLTLRFVGEVDEGTADDIDSALLAVRAPGFAVELAGVGHFGDAGAARALYLGVERNPALAHLQERVEAAVVRAGCEPERRRFTPHVTLARLKRAPTGRVRDFVAGNALFRLPPFTADRFALYSSHRARAGADYREEAAYPLAAGPIP